MSDNNYKKLGVAPRFHEVLSTGLYTGLVPFAPGTVAAFTGLLLWYALYLFCPVMGHYSHVLVDYHRDNSGRMDIGYYGELLGP